MTTQQLQAEIQDKQQRIEELEQILTDLDAFLAKFRYEIWVRRTDVLQRVKRWTLLRKTT